MRLDESLGEMPGDGGDGLSEVRDSSAGEKGHRAQGTGHRAQGISAATGGGTRRSMRTGVGEHDQPQQSLRAASASTRGKGGTGGVNVMVPLGWVGGLWVVGCSRGAAGTWAGSVEERMFTYRKADVCARERSNPAADGILEQVGCHHTVRPPPPTTRQLIFICPFNGNRGPLQGARSGPVQ